MWAYQPRSTRQSANLCAKEPPHTNLRHRPCDGVCHQSHLVVVSDSKLLLNTHSHGQARRFENDASELRRHDVRFRESSQLVRTPVEIHVDGKIITGIEGRRKSVT